MSVQSPTARPPVRPSARRADLLIIAACLLWGVAFPVVKYGLGFSTPLAFVALRYAVAAVVLTALTPLLPLPRGGELRGGLLLGVLLGVAFAAQGIGLVTTTPSRSAFIIALASVVAPFVARITIREPLHWRTLGALGVAGFGLYFLIAPDGGGGPRVGDLWTMLAALVLGAQIVAVRELSQRHDARRLVWIQSVAIAVGVTAAMAVLEDVRVVWSPGFVAALAYTSIFTSVVAFLWQMRGQREMTSQRAALLFCFEPVFATLTSWAWMGDRLSVTQWMGAGLILAGMILAELPQPTPREAAL